MGTELRPDALVVRELGSGDLRPLLRLYRHLHASDAPAPADAERIWQKISADSAQIYRGGFVDGELVAAGNAAVIPNLTRGGRPYALIENVVTHADYRRRGIARAVMRTLIDCCWERDCYKIMLMSAAHRSAGHEFYEALGFDRASKQAFVLVASR